MFLDILLLFLSLVATFALIELAVYVLRLRVEVQGLREENQGFQSEVKYMEDMHTLFTNLFRMCFTVLDLGQHILEELFPNEGSCISMYGPVLRKMFEYLVHSDLPVQFLESGSCFTFKVHSCFVDFCIFARSFARYIHANQMRLPGTSFIVTSMKPVRPKAEYRSCDQVRVYRAYVFVVRFYDKNSKRSFLLEFKCDAGAWCPEEDFDVNLLEFHATRGLSAMLNGKMVPVLAIIRAICEKSTQWNIIRDAHFSSLKNVISMMESNMYSLHGCPSICPTERCPFSFESSSFALEFSGCKCAPHVREISVGMLCQRLKSDPFSTLKCPFCKVEFPSMAYEPNRSPNSFDLTCLDEELSAAEIHRLQSDAQASVVQMVFQSADLEAKHLQEQLSNTGKARFSRYYRIPKFPDPLFFGEESDDESDDESEDELVVGYNPEESESDDEDGDRSPNYSDEWDSSDSDSD